MNTYAHKKIVIGSGLQALIDAHCNDASVILTEELAPHPLESLENDFSSIGYTGRSALELYNSLLFSLSVSGRAPFAGKVVAVEEPEAGLLNVVLEGSLGECNIRYQDIKYVNPDISQDKKVVVDWIDVRQGQRHDFDRIDTPDDFVHIVYFYPSRRVANSSTSGLKDAVAVSLLSDEQILSTEYSEFLVQKKVKSLMEANGIRGPKNGKDPRNPEKQKYYSIKLEPKKREVYPLILSKYEIPTTYLTSRDVFLSLGAR